MRWSALEFLSVISIEFCGVSLELLECQKFVKVLLIIGQILLAHAKSMEIEEVFVCGPHLLGVSFGYGGLQDSLSKTSKTDTLSAF